jgi:hypothetical protein
VSTFEDRLRYTPSRCFETFPFPEALDADPELEASEARVDETLLRLVDTGKSCVGLAIVGDATKVRIEGAISDEVWNRLHNEVGRTNPKYVGYAGARNRFLHFFPNGFHSNGYRENERGYKVAARDRLVQSVPLADAAEGLGFGEAVLAVFRATNLLSPFEKTRLQEVLRGQSADPFILAAARFTLNPTTAALFDMERALRPYDAAKWTVVTYLPFLWRPEAQMFLKPEVTKDFAARVGHRFASDYEPRLKLDVYHSLLDLASETEQELAELEPRDRIDVQSFIWVIGSYKEDTEPPRP